MKEKMHEFMEKLEDQEFSTTEIILAFVVAFLSGVVLGIMFSPKKHVVIGSNNGNNNNGTLCDCDCDDDFDEDDEE